MLDIRYVLENMETVRWNTLLKHKDIPYDFYDLPQFVHMLNLDRDTRSNFIAWRKRLDYKKDIQILKEIASLIKDIDNEILEQEERVNKIMKQLPNIAVEEVPVKTGVAFGQFMESKI